MPGHVCPAGLALGHSFPQVRLADGTGDDLIDVVGEAVPEACRWTFAEPDRLLRDFGTPAVLNVQPDDDFAYPG
jgi:hypothetical protein